MKQTEEAEVPANTSAAKSYVGTCHCGKVRFEVEIDIAGASRCNCSICTKTSVTGGIVKPDAFRLVSGEEHLSSYEWASKMSKRFFCKECGVHCFGRGHLAQLGGDFVSININTLDDVELTDLKVVYWDGRHNNWEAGPRGTPWPMLA